MKFKRKKHGEVEKICKNCLLYDIENQFCSVIVLHKGKKINLPTNPDDPCIFENDEIQQVKMWVEDENGNKTDKDGTVKIEYPENFFGKEINNE